MQKIYKDITAVIGRTPLVKMNNLTKGLSSTMLLKLEFMNPGSSVKDRTALGMIQNAMQQGKIHANSILIEASSGNTGIGLAMIAAVYGLKLMIVMPETMSQERRKLLQAYGAQLVLTPGNLGMTGAIDKAKELVKNNKNCLLMNQFSNPSNPAIHYKTTAEEIWQDTEGEVDILVAGVGTGGTITGIAELIKSRKAGFRIIAVEPLTSSVLSGENAGKHGIQGIGAGFIPQILNTQLIDEVIAIDDATAFSTARKVARSEGILIGISGGAAVAAALKVAQLPANAGKQIVVIIPDSGERYLSTLLFEE